MSNDDNKNTHSQNQVDTTPTNSNFDGSSVLKDNKNNLSKNKVVFKRNSDIATDSPKVLNDRLQDSITDKKNTENISSTKQSLESLRSEIEQAFGDTSDPSPQKIISKNDQVINMDDTTNEIIDSSEEPLLPITPKAHTTNNKSVSPSLEKTDKNHNANFDENNKKTTSQTALSQAQENHEDLVASIKADIESDFEKNNDEDFQETQGIPSTKGVGQTYYSDLSTVMGANDPTTMSELLEKSRYEKESARILSPKSKRNLMFIVGAIVLLLVSVGIIYAIFSRREDPVEFISEERVSSLIFTNQDTGINVTGLEATRIKQAIRTVVEREIPEDTINQIYYVEQFPDGTIRRLGIKDIFEKTDNQTSNLLFNNIESNFTHGVYGTDNNYPFMILKALSYDRALEGMKDWEPTMVNDLATYFDLPEEASNQSLIDDGFEDDLIRNKNVRVARFIPREADGRGILDFLRLNNSSNTNENQVNQEESINTSNGIEFDQEGNLIQENENISGLINRIQLFVYNYIGSSQAFAQSSFFGNSVDNTGGERICYQIQKSCIDRTTGSSVEYQQGNTNQLCTDIRVNNTPLPATPALEGDVLNYSCINTLGGGEAISQVDNPAPICFRNDNGERLNVPDTATQFCFESYRCNRLACTSNGVEVPSSQQGQPGVVCGTETSDLVGIDSPLPKVCREFTDILSYQNINESPVCFDTQSNYLKYKTPNDPRLGFNCIMPQNRSNRLCITSQDKVVVRTGEEIFTTDQFCFEPNQQAATNIGVNDQCSALTTLQVQSRLGWAVLELRLLAGLGSLFGLSNEDVGNINEVANYLSDLSQGNILQIEEVRQTALVLQTLELILNNVDPNQQLPQTGPNGGLNLYGTLREIIDTVKCTLGIANTLQWSTLARIPTGITPIFQGQSLPQVETVQQVLALTGLLDPLSVNGTLDLDTQDAISQLQLANALEVTGIIDTETLDLINEIIEGQDGLINEEAIITELFVYSDGNIVTQGVVDADGNIVTQGVVDADGNIVTQGVVDADGNITTAGIVDASEVILTLGAYNNSVQNLQTLLFAEGYQISSINGFFDEETCAAVIQFQIDNGLEPSEPTSCSLGPDTINSLNNVLLSGAYIGSGFTVNGQGFLEGVGNLQGTVGPGVANFEVSQADADTLREGDIILMYTFLDEETILIARDQIVIDEIIQRRALSDIFDN